MPGLADTPMGGTDTAASEEGMAPQPVYEYDPLPCLDDEPEGGLSTIGRADFRIATFKKIIEWHERNHPGAVPTCKASLADAIAAREALSDTPANHRVGNPEAPKLIVLERVKDLKEALAQSEFEPEKVNIKAAIDAYESGEVGYSKGYTLIWAGQVVDSAATYGEFSVNRAERLDRYAEKYGPHWLWWESPLDVHPNDQLQAKGCQVIPRRAQPGGLGHFWIHQRYQKQSGFVMRLPNEGGEGDLKPLNASERSAFQTDAHGRVNCGDLGPIYEMPSMLDSGASCASLYSSDLKELGIVKKHYSAQSYGSFNLANGAFLKQKIFELHVEVGGNEGTPIIDSKNPIVPGRLAIGGIFPVVEIPQRIKSPFDEGSYIINNRLSGIMPFLSSYLSIVPGSNIMLLGENRNDIIGHYKMPPFRVWDFHGSQEAHINPLFNYIDNPLLYFRHQAEQITEQDHTPLAVQTTKDGQTYMVFPQNGQT